MSAHIRPLERGDAARLAVLITGYRAAMGTTDAPTMSELEAQNLIASAKADPRILLIGADTDSGLAGFALVFGLPEIISGARRAAR